MNMGSRQFSYAVAIACICLGIYAAVRVVTVQGIPPRNPARTFLLVEGLLIAAALIMGGVGVIWSSHHREQIRAMRTAITERATSTNDRLARIQPMALHRAVPLPITISVRTRWMRYLTYLAIWSLAWTAALAFILYLGGSAMHGIGDFFLRYYPGIALGVIPYAFIAMVTRQQIEVTPVGVLQRVGRGTQFVAFENAQLFALAGGHPKNQSPIEYELSNAVHTVRWGRVRRQMPFDLFDPITLTTPTIPFEEYDRQMETMLSVIADKTGLPLYDLR